MESTPSGLTSGFVAGDEQGLWVIADASGGAPGVLRLSGGRWERQCLPVSGTVVTAAYGSRDDDLWLAGSGTLLHWDGAVWTSAASPLPQNDFVSEIWGDGPEAFAASQRGTLLRWNGSQWSTAGAGHSPWGDGKGHAWALTPGGDRVLQWDGTAWQDIGGPPPGMFATSLWASAAGEVWLFVATAFRPGPGQPGGTLHVLRGGAGGFTDAGFSIPTTGFPRWIRGSSSSDVWIALDPAFFDGPAQVHHWDGTRWSLQPATSSAFHAPHVLPGGKALAWEGGALKRLDGQPSGSDLQVAPLDVTGVAATAGGSVWMTTFAGGLWHLDGQTFRRMPWAPGFVIAVAVTSDDDLWTMDEIGAIAHWDGTSLHPIAAPSGGWELMHLAAGGPGRLWTVGSLFSSQGQIDWTAWRWDGQWTPFTAPPDMTFPTAIAAGPDGDLWVVTAQTLWHLQGQSWERHDFPGAQLGSIVQSGGGEIWVSGDRLLHFDGVRWNDAGTFTFATMSARGPDDIWAMGSPKPDGTNFDLWHWDGTSWTPQHASMLPLSLVALDRGEVWGATTNGVLHRRPR
ncbi:MAG TPA: hypothetical protein VGH20_09125 [Myxococcales bacterium]|jgi:hypothetical protein